MFTSAGLSSGYWDSLRRDNTEHDHIYIYIYNTFHNPSIFYPVTKSYVPVSNTLNQTNLSAHMYTQRQTQFHSTCHRRHKPLTPFHIKAKYNLIWCILKDCLHISWVADTQPGPTLFLWISKYGFFWTGHPLTKVEFKCITFHSVYQFYTTVWIFLLLSGPRLQSWLWCFDPGTKSCSGKRTSCCTS